MIWTGCTRLAAFSRRSLQMRPLSSPPPPSKTKKMLLARSRKKTNKSRSPRLSARNSTWRCASSQPLWRYSSSNSYLLSGGAALTALRLKSTLWAPTLARSSSKTTREASSAKQVFIRTWRTIHSKQTRTSWSCTVEIMLLVSVSSTLRLILARPLSTCLWCWLGRSIRWAPLTNSFWKATLKRTLVPSLSFLSLVYRKILR